jgi:hypothetical protein
MSACSRGRGARLLEPVVPHHVAHRERLGVRRGQMVAGRELPAVEVDLEAEVGE